jgi:hypothetical protein
MVSAQFQYKHTQFGYITVLALGTALIAMAVLLASSFHWIGLASFALLLACLVAFASLTVAVNRDSLRLWFGPGVLGRSIPLRQIAAVQVVTNSPLMGWGVHWIWSGWIYNVSGLHGIELRLKDGRRVRIGSDEPEALALAVEQALRAG